MRRQKWIKNAVKLQATIGYFMTGCVCYIHLGLQQSEGTYEREDRLKL